MISKCKFVTKLFYSKPPQSLGEGLARIKKKFHASGEDLSSKPGVRKYCSRNGRLSMDICNFNTPFTHSKGIKGNTETSRLTIANSEGRIKYFIDYCICHDGVGKEAVPYRYRTISKVENIAYKLISRAKMYF